MDVGVYFKGSLECHANEVQSLLIGNRKLLSVDLMNH